MTLESILRSVTWLTGAAAFVTLLYNTHKRAVGLEPTHHLGVSVEARGAGRKEDSEVLRLTVCAKYIIPHKRG